MLNSRDSAVIREHWEGLLDELSRAASDRGFWSVSESHRCVAFAGAVDGFRAAGLLSEAEHSEWLDRLGAIVRNAADRTSGGAASATTAATDVASPAVKSADGRNEFTELDPARVIVAPSSACVDGLRLVSIELYARHVAVRWNFRGRRGGSPHDQLPNLTLRDDIGTIYEPQRGSSTGGNGLVVSGLAWFVPGASPVARELRVGVGDRVIRLDLQRNRS